MVLKKDHERGDLMRLSEYSKQIILQWTPGHCGVTGNMFADHLAKKGASIQQITRKAVPFTSAKRIIKKKLNDVSSRQYAERNSNKIWWNNLKDLPIWPRCKAVAEFLMNTGPDCLPKHLHRIHAAQAPFCTLCDFREDMDADHIHRCPALNGFSLCDL
ncbi:putative gag-pol polyprotein [Trichonephila clavipes]|nr:putative gag-pol polyprotein [Trichonephila clavipes]